MMEENKTLATPQDEDVVEQRPEEEQEEATETTPQNEEESQDIWDKPLDEVDEEQIFANEPPAHEEEETPDEQPQEESKKFILKHKGKEIVIDNEEELVALAQKGLDYEFKMSRIKPFRKAVDIIEKSGLTPEEVQALADAKDGKPEALEYLAKQYGIKLGGSDDIDILLDEEPHDTNYKPSVEQHDPVQEIWEDVVRNDKELSGKVAGIWEELDDSFKSELWNPDTFSAFVGSVKTGEFEKVYPEAIKIKALNPALGWLQAYITAAQKIQQPNTGQEVKQEMKQAARRSKKRTGYERTTKEIDPWKDESSIEELEKMIFGGE